MFRNAKRTYSVALAITAVLASAPLHTQDTEIGLGALV